jgi:integrase
MIEIDVADMTPLEAQRAYSEASIRRAVHNLQHSFFDMMRMGGMDVTAPVEVIMRHHNSDAIVTMRLSDINRRTNQLDYTIEWPVPEDLI